MNLIDRMTGLRDRLTAIPIRLGLPQYRDVLVYSSTIPEGSSFAVKSETLIDPKPYITPVPPRLIGQPYSGGSIILTQDDWIISKVSRNYDKSLFTQDVDHLIIDPVFEGVTLTQGLKCKIIHLDESKALEWVLILRQYGDIREVG